MCVYDCLEAVHVTVCVVMCVYVHACTHTCTHIHTHTHTHTHTLTVFKLDEFCGACGYSYWYLSMEKGNRKGLAQFVVVVSRS